MTKKRFQEMLQDKIEPKVISPDDPDGPFFALTLLILGILIAVMGGGW